MKVCNKLVRDNVPDVLNEQGYNKIDSQKLKGEKYKTQLYSLFFAEYKETLNKEKPNQLQVHYAEMLEIIRTLMVASKTKIKDVGLEENQTLEWYKNSSPSKNKLRQARVDLLQKFDELLQLRTEAVKDQLGDIIKSFKELVNSHNLSFAQVEEVRRVMYKKLGGYSKGIYIEKVAKMRLKTSTYSA